MMITGIFGIVPSDQQRPERLIFILYSSNQLRCMAVNYEFKYKIFFVNF